MRGEVGYSLGYVGLSFVRFDWLSAATSTDATSVGLATGRGTCYSKNDSLIDSSIDSGRSSRILFAQNESGIFAQSESGIFAQNESGIFAQSESGIFAQSESGIFAQNE